MKKTALFLSAILTASAVSCTAKKSDPSSASMPMNEQKLTEDGRPVVTVGNFGYLDDYFSNHLIQPKEYDIELINYFDLVDRNSYDLTTEAGYRQYSEAVTRAFDMELIKGNAPDILFDGVEQMRRLIDKGGMADMFELMEEYGGIQREDFTDCALEGLTIDGKLPALMENYYIYTCAAKSKFVPKEYTDWTAADAMSFYEKAPQLSENMAFCENDGKYSLASYMLSVLGMDCIDERNGKCDFTGAFRDALDFCKEHPMEEMRSPDYASMDEFDWFDFQFDMAHKALNDEMLVYPIDISGINIDLADKTYGYFGGEDITFVGYPCEKGESGEKGCGAYIWSFSPLVGICSQSSNKELAWDLLNRIITYRPRDPSYANNATRGIPVFKSEIEYYRDLPADHVSSVNGSINGEYYRNDPSGEYPMPKEYKDMLIDYILSVPANPYRESSVNYMIKEECEPVILDSRTADEAVKILQNRIETYLSEKYN